MQKCIYILNIAILLRQKRTYRLDRLTVDSARGSVKYEGYIDDNFMCNLL